MVAISTDDVSKLVSTSLISSSAEVSAELSGRVLMLVFDVPLAIELLKLEVSDGLHAESIEVIAAYTRINATAFFIM